MPNTLLDVDRDNADLLKYLQPAIWSWKGISGKGVPLQQVSVTDDGKYAVDAHNAGANGLSLRAWATDVSLTVTDGGVALTGPTTVTGDLTVTGDTILDGTLNVLDDTALWGTLTVVGSTLLGDDLEVDGNTDLGGTLSVTGAAQFGSVVSITGNTTVGGTLGVTGATSLASTLSVTGNAALWGTLGVVGATTLASTLDVTGNLTVSTSALAVDAAANKVRINRTTAIGTADLSVGANGIATTGGLAAAGGAFTGNLSSTQSVIAGGTTLAGTEHLRVVGTSRLEGATTITTGGLHVEGLTIVQTLTFDGTGTIFSLAGSSQAQLTVGPSGAASALPALPRAYLKIVYGAENLVIPAYTAA